MNINEDPEALVVFRELVADFHFGMTVAEVRAKVDSGEIDRDGDRPVHLVLGFDYE